MHILLVLNEKKKKEIEERNRLFQAREEQYYNINSGEHWDKVKQNGTNT